MPAEEEIDAYIVRKHGPNNWVATDGTRSCEGSDPEDAIANLMIDLDHGDGTAAYWHTEIASGHSADMVCNAATRIIRFIGSDEHVPYNSSLEKHAMKDVELLTRHLADYFEKKK